MRKLVFTLASLLMLSFNGFAAKQGYESQLGAQSTACPKSDQSGRSAKPQQDSEGSEGQKQANGQQ